MSDWQVGDLAVCVKDGRAFEKCGLFEGRAYRVTEVVVARPHAADAGELGLNFESISPPAGKIGIKAKHFRKIRPDKHEACETEFVTLLKRSKQRVVA